jgi:hypothetical protein
VSCSEKRRPQSGELSGWSKMMPSYGRGGCQGRIEQ